ncbi:MAG: hypothetical protein AB1472_07660 [Candidatus Omnitrophota bacterium]
MAQLHKRFTDSQIKELFKRYLSKEIKRVYIQEILGIKRRRFFTLLKQYQTAPKNFSIQYTRKTPSRNISVDIENNIFKELNIQKDLIKNEKVPIKSYNYSYIKDRLANDYKQKVSLHAIINRAKANDFHLGKRKKKIHDREVLTQYAGELIQHDSSYHLWAPNAKEKWSLITSLDDYSRFILYAAFVRPETSWGHINAMQTMFLRYGCPYQFYVDSHSIFRFVAARDSIHYKHHLQTDDTNTQWKQVLEDCNVKIIYALSPQAKGKIERPYGWLQDRIIRNCVREDVTEIKHAQLILNREIHRYNYKQIHSTTEEVPYFKFQKALKEKSLFRKFSVKPPFQSPKDIFCFRLSRIVDQYRKISIKNLEFKVKGYPKTKVDIRIFPLGNALCELRFWFNGKLLNIQKAKNKDIGIVHF